MGKRVRSRRKSQSTQRRFSMPWLIVGVALLLVVGGLGLLWSSAGQPSGTPELVVDQTVVDEGYQTYGTPIQTAFRLQNVGDGPLYITGEPVVELVEGC